MKKIKRDNLISIILILAIAGTSYRFLSILPNSNLIVGESQEITTTINGVEYIFKKDQSLLAVSTNDQSSNFNATNHYNNAITSPEEGETYPCLGINIKVVGIDEDKYVINVSPKN